MRVHTPHDPQGRGTARGHPQHQQRRSYPHRLRPVRAPAQKRHREEQANPPPKRKHRRGEAPRIHEQTPAGQRERRKKVGQSHNREANDPLHRGGQPPSQATPKATPAGPADRTPGDHPAQPKDAQLETAAPHDHKAAKGREEKTPWPRRRTPAPGKWQATGHTDTDKTKKKPIRRGGGGRRSRQPGLRQATASTTGPQHNRAKKPHPQTPSPAARKTAKKKEGGEKPRPRRPPHSPPPQAAPSGWWGTGGARARGHTPQHPSQE